MGQVEKDLELEAGPHKTIFILKIVNHQNDTNLLRGSVVEERR